MIAIIDYGSGNIKAISNIYRRSNVPFFIASSPNDLKRATKIVLPGVGAFDQAMGELERSGMKGGLDERVLGDGIPLLGICVGMQLLAKSSEEGTKGGLGWIPGTVRKIARPGDGVSPRLPHMGWNTVALTRDDVLFNGVDLNLGFYFLHSYCFKCDTGANELAQTDYEGVFASAVKKDRIYGVQFHPEKSHQSGIRVLQNFAELA